MLTVTLLAATVFAGDWDRQKAFAYLEARQQKWAEWKPAQKEGGACISCHTGLSYLMARRVLGEKGPRPVEKALVDGVKFRVLANPPKTMLNYPGAEAILNLLTLALQRRDVKEPVTEAESLALKRLWAAQEAKGAWPWIQNDLHPVESEHSVFYGAVLAEMALAPYPGQNTSSVKAFLAGEAPKQPLHNRLAWVALGSGASAKQAVLQELWRAQGADGGWTNAALGPWSARPEAPVTAAGSSPYATAWAAFTARQAGVPCEEPKMKKALHWLEERQDRTTGQWNAVSMNKSYPADSLQAGFMSDMTTGFATAALLSCGQ